MKPKGKLYYTIGEVATMLNVSKSVIRYWENEFDFIRPHRNNRGERKFTEQTIRELRIVHHLIKEKGFTVAGAKKELATNKDFRINVEKTIESLERVKESLNQLLHRINK